MIAMMPCVHVFPPFTHTHTHTHAHWQANSIEGCKMKEVDVVYTRWRNLKKTKSMEVGQVGFHDQAKVRKCKAEKNNAVVNALNRTKEVGG